MSDNPIVEAPQILVDLVSRRNGHNSGSKINLLSDGRWHTDLISYIGKMRAKGISEDEILTLSLALNTASGNVPLPESEVMKMVKEYEHQSKPNSALPEIIVTNRQLRDVADESLQGLIDSNNPPFIFNADGELARITDPNQNGGIIQHLSEDMLIDRMTRVMNFTKIVKKTNGKYENIAIPPPTVIAKNLLSRTYYQGIPQIKGIKRTPIIRDDGTIFVTPGYDPITKYNYQPISGFNMPLIPEKPIEGQAINAMGEVSDIFSEFPFVDIASRDNYLAMVLTLTFRHLIKGITPIAIIDKNSRGIGAGLLTDCAFIIATGSPSPITNFSRNEEELEKRLHSALMSRKYNIVFDNVETAFSSAIIASMSTAKEITMRAFNQNTRMTTIENRLVWMANGINFDIGGDVQRRVYYSRLDSKMPQPWLIEGFKYKLPDYIYENRGKILANLYTACRYWIQNGKPTFEGKHIANYEEWTDVIGGMLQSVGLTSFQGNLDKVYRDADKEGTETENFISACYERYCKNPGGKVTTASILKELKDDPAFMAMLPSKVSHKLDTINWSLGKWLASKNQTRFMNGLTVFDAGYEHNAKVWIFTHYEGGELDTLKKANSPETTIQTPHLF